MTNNTQEPEQKNQTAIACSSCGREVKIKFDRVEVNHNQNCSSLLENQPRHPPQEPWEKGFEKTKFAKGGGACFECGDYEGMYVDLKDFVRSEKEKSRRETLKEAIELVWQYEGNMVGEGNTEAETAASEIRKALQSLLQNNPKTE